MNNTHLTGKTIVLTGATSGIGLQTAIQLSGGGAEVIGVGRSAERCRQAEETIRKTCPEARIHYLVTDLSSLGQVRGLAARIREVLAQDGKKHIDVLINNAGTVSSWYTSTEDGFELQFAVNHLAPFLLTHELLPLLGAADEGRVITISSGSHYRTRINWRDILLRKHYNCLSAYKQSKLANVLFCTEFNRRVNPGSSVRAFAIDPGLVNTDIGFKGTTGIARWIWQKRSSSGIAPADAASSVVYLAGEPAIKNTSHVYWKECKPLEPSKYSQREDEAGRLWELSEKMCGIRYQF
jgi:NAD(P)-dependent dehydrogenase (short-subunit alcohol dehydrogenase family)